MTTKSDTFVMDLAGLDAVLKALREAGFTLVGPTVQDEAIIYDEIASLEELPKGWTDEQGPGVYRITKSDSPSLFDYNTGPHAWKKFLNPSRMRLWTAEKNTTGFEVIPEKREIPAYAFIGVRACDLNAIRIQDKVFRTGTSVESYYDEARDNAFVLAVNCTRAGGTCFCASMNAGPRVGQGFDLALTELVSQQGHVFVIEVGSEQGLQILGDVPKERAGAQTLQLRDQCISAAAESMGRSMQTENLRELLVQNPEHPRWADVAERCLSCANCTMACPTCFCSTVEDTTDLTGDHAERWKRWDSCFTMDFSYVAGGVIRSSTRSRYRQWMTHKLATWHDQFGTGGCVGCGRCITWCPVGIDITEEVRAIQSSTQTHPNRP